MVKIINLITSLLFFPIWKKQDINFFKKSNVKKNRVNLYWWNGCVNLGDYLSYVIYQWITNEKNLDNDKYIEKTKYVLGVGSVITHGTFEATVWGSGVLQTSYIPYVFDKSYFRKLDIRAVRGPITRHIMRCAGYECPEIYGDPAILMPFIYQPTNIEKKYNVSLVCHYAKKEKSEYHDINYIDIETNDYEKFIDELVASEKVISSSLHGIILAETYGVPAVFLNKDTKDDLKFWDWYMSTGRNNVKFAKSLEEAYEMNPMEPINSDKLKTMQKQIFDAFPIDLWD